MFYAIDLQEFMTEMFIMQYLYQSYLFLYYFILIWQFVTTVNIVYFDFGQGMECYFLNVTSYQGWVVLN